MQSARLLAMGWFFQLKMLWRDPFTGFFQVLYPIFFATVAFLMFRAGTGAESLLYASLGASVMGIWAATATTAGSAMQRERWHGTLELLVGTPPHFALVLLPVTLAMATIGIYSLVATLLYGHFLFGIPLIVVHPLLFAASIVVTVLSFGALGFVFAVTFVRFRAAWALGNIFEYPVWLIGGFLVPLGLLPDWVRPFSWVLAPTWGMSAIRESALGGSALDDLLLCVGLGAVYVALGIILTERVLRSARVRATLSLS